MDRIGFKVRIIAPYFKRIPPELEENWAKKTKEGREKAKQGSERAIQTPEDFDDKIGKRAKKGIASFIDQKWRSKRDLSYDDMMHKTDDSLASARKDYPQRVKAGYEPGKFEEDVEYGRKEYARQWLRITGPLQGYKEGKVKGLSALGVMAICGDPDAKGEASGRLLADTHSELKNSLKKGIDTIEGITCRAVTKKPRRPPPHTRVGRVGFKRVLNGRITHWGREIMGTGYKERVLKQANAELNRLVDGYRREEIIPFTPGGTSHIDFIWVEVPDLDRPGRRMKWLGLDIQVTQK